MKFGVCMDAYQAITCCPGEADYIEVAGKHLWAMEPAEFEQVRRAVKDGVFRAYSCNQLVDKVYRLTGPDVDLAAIGTYCDKLFARLAEIGVKILVFGSGKAKHVPDGFPMDKAWEQLLTLGHLLADKAAPYGQTVVVEPLSYAEVNIVNTLDDGAYYVKTVNRDNFKLLADFYHMDANGEFLAALEPQGEILKHIHFATQGLRSIPRTEAEWGFFQKCLVALKAIGYEGALTFEGKNFEIGELDRVLHRMKEIANTL